MEDELKAARKRIAELEAQVAALREGLSDMEDAEKARLRDVAERQRDACAAPFATGHPTDNGIIRVIRATPLVTEEPEK